MNDVAFDILSPGPRYARNEASRRIQCLIETRETHATTNSKPKLMELLHSFKDLQCLDARDKVFGLRGLASDGAHLKVDYGKPVTFTFLQALSMNQPTIQRLTYSAFAHPGDNLKNALEMCSWMPLTITDILSTFPLARDRSVKDWVVYIGEVVFCDERPMRKSTRKPSGQFEIITLKGDRHQEYFYYARGNSETEVGDKVYTLHNPADVERFIEEGPVPIVLVFRGAQWTSRVIDILTGLWDMGQIPPDPDERNLQDYEYLRMAFAGLVEERSLNSSAQHIINQPPRIMLVHINWITMLALMVYFTRRSIPREFSAAILQHSMLATAFCNCTDH